MSPYSMFLYTLRALPAVNTSNRIIHFGEKHHYLFSSCSSLVSGVVLAEAASAVAVAPITITNYSLNHAMLRM
jgi:hypothetical protein